MRKRPSSPSARFAGNRQRHRRSLALEKRIAFDGAAAAYRGQGGPHDNRRFGSERTHSLAEASRDTDIAAHRDSQTEHGLAPRSDRGRFAARCRRSRGLDARRQRPPRGTSAVDDVEKRGLHRVRRSRCQATLIKDIDHSAQIVLLDASKVDGVDAIAVLPCRRTRECRTSTSSRTAARVSSTSARRRWTRPPCRAATRAIMATIKACAGSGCQHPGLRLRLRRRASTGDSAAAHLLSQLTGAAIAASTNLTGGDRRRR